MHRHLISLDLLASIRRLSMVFYAARARHRHGFFRTLLDEYALAAAAARRYEHLRAQARGDRAEFARQVFDEHYGPRSRLRR